VVFSTGCITTNSDGDERATFNLGWLIGAIGMAVDGDDRDDYERWFRDECDCDCDCKCH
jgi:hypothetical protein